MSIENWEDLQNEKRRLKESLSYREGAVRGMASEIGSDLKDVVLHKFIIPVGVAGLGALAAKYIRQYLQEDDTSIKENVTKKLKSKYQDITSSDSDGQHWFNMDNIERFAGVLKIILPIVMAVIANRTASTPTSDE